MYVVAIVSFIGLMAWLFSQQIDEQRNPNQAPTGSTTLTGATQVRLQRNRQGHYIANGEINGARAEFIVDTGATDVAVSAEVARRAGLVAGPAVAVATANGRATAYVTRIDELKLGTIVEHNVRATIVPNLGEIEVLLGMSFLKRLDFAQNGDALILTSHRQQRSD